MLLLRDDTSVSVKTLYENQLEDNTTYTPTDFGFDFALSLDDSNLVNIFN